MKKADGSPGKTTHLRNRAEEQLRANTPEALPPRTEEEVQRLLHELQVHQIELEMQNAELRQARDELETALERYTDLYDFAPVGYFTLARDTGIRAVNLTGAVLLGLERSRLIGRSFEPFIAPESRHVFTSFLGKACTSRKRESCEIEIVGHENRRFFGRIEARAGESGDECRIAVIDITKRRRAEDALTEKQRELEELNRSLEERISRAVDELRSKDQMLITQDRMAVMGEMINNIAHQWRQPLNALGILIQEIALLSDPDDSGKQFVENSSRTAMDLIRHMSQTIDDFRRFFRSDKEPVCFGIIQVINHTLSLIEKSFLDQQIILALTTEGNPEVVGFPNEYAQVLLNILMNARDALIERAVQDARISIRAFGDGGKTVVTITDNAGGIDNEYLDRLFEPYFTTKGPDKGIGIGLFMSKVIVEKNMGGRLTVRNTGSGAEFRIEV